MTNLQIIIGTAFLASFMLPMVVLFSIRLLKQIPYLLTSSIRDYFTALGILLKNSLVSERKNVKSSDIVPSTLRGMRKLSIN